MELIWGIAAIGIFLGIIGLVAWDSVDQIRRSRNEWKVYRKNNKNRSLRF